jgi:site-specific recombinase XerD
MAKTPYVEDRDLKKMLKIAAVSGELPVRNVPMLRTLYGTGMTLQKIARLSIKAYLGVNGNVLDESYVSEEVAYNGTRRPVFWSNKELIVALDQYLAAADVVSEMGLSEADRSSLDDYDKRNLKRIQGERSGSIKLRGL